MEQKEKTFADVGLNENQSETSCEDVEKKTWLWHTEKRSVVRKKGGSDKDY